MIGRFRRTYIILLILIAGGFSAIPSSTRANGTSRAVAAAAHRPAQKQHRTYWYSALYTGAPILHSGDRIVVRWTAHRGPLSKASQPTHLALIIRIFGAYKSVDALKKDDPNHAAATVRGGGLTQTTNWSHRSFTSRLKIPRTAVHGYYDLVTRITDSVHSQGGASIFEIR